MGRARTRSRMMLPLLLLLLLRMSLLLLLLLLLLISFAVSVLKRGTDNVFIFFYRSTDAMLTMVKRRYLLGSTSTITAGKCTDTAHHSEDISARHTRVGGRARSVVRCFKGKSLWLDT